MAKFFPKEIEEKISELTSDLAEKANKTELDLKSNIFYENPIQATLLNGWLNFGSSNDVASYWKDSLGVIHLKGSVKSGTIPGTILNLPNGYRPKLNMTFYTSHKIIITSGGDVYVIGSDNGLVVLDNISFRVEDQFVQVVTGQSSIIGAVKFDNMFSSYGLLLQDNAITITYTDYNHFTMTFLPTIYGTTVKETAFVINNQASINQQDAGAIYSIVYDLVLSKVVITAQTTFANRCIVLATFFNGKIYSLNNNAFKVIGGNSYVPPIGC